jgi:hypothetical protein
MTCDVTSIPARKWQKGCNDNIMAQSTPKIETNENPMSGVYSLDILILH